MSDMALLLVGCFIGFELGLVTCAIAQWRARKR